jgi:hypothetical protein
MVTSTINHSQGFETGVVVNGVTAMVFRKRISLIMVKLRPSNPKLLPASPNLILRLFRCNVQVEKSG